MMAPTALDGVATADQRHGGSWGTTRTGIIATEALRLRQTGRLTATDLVAAVDAAFVRAGVDPADPSGYR